MVDPEPIPFDAEVSLVEAPASVVDVVDRDASTLVPVSTTELQVATIAAPGDAVEAIEQPVALVSQIAREATTTTGITTAGPQGPPGPPGDSGDCDYDDLPDLTLIFENGLI